MIRIANSRLIDLLGLALLALCLQCKAATTRGPLSATKQVTIQAAPEVVWSRLANFDSLHEWHPGFSSDEIVKGTNNEPGAVRKLTLKDGPSFTEELLEYDGAQHTMRYRIIESPLPFDSYVSSIRVEPGSTPETAVAIWEGTFKRKNPTPTESGETDEGVVELVNGVYDAGLGNLKKIAEAQ